MFFTLIFVHLTGCKAWIEWELMRLKFIFYLACITGFIGMFIFLFKNEKRD